MCPRLGFGAEDRVEIVIEHPTARLRRLTEDCTVLIAGQDVRGGSGFFVAPGLIITCAHTVAGLSGAVPEQVAVAWQDMSLTGRVRAVVPAENRDAALWPYPDLCVIELDVVPPAQPSVVLGELRGDGYPEVSMSGFAKVFDVAGASLLQALGRLAGAVEVEGGILWRVAYGEIAPGISGGPVLDLRSGLVCGVTKATRSTGVPLGGWIIPATAIRTAFPDVWTANQEASRQNDQWMALQEALREPADPLASLLTPREREELISAADQLGLRRPDFNALWREIVTDSGPQPVSIFENVTDLAAALTELPEGDLSPLAKLFALLGDLRLARHRDALHDYADGLARREGHLEELRLYCQRARGDHRIRDALPLSGIFICYRRDDARYTAGWLYDRLSDRFGDSRVFMDIESILPGDDFSQAIVAAVRVCKVLLAIIGGQWLADSDGRNRLWNPEDFVRLELEAALAYNLRVIPVLIEDAEMPLATDLPPSLAELVRRQAFELSARRTGSDIARLVRKLDSLVA